MARERGVIGFFVVFFLVIFIGVWIAVIIVHANLLDTQRKQKDLLEKEVMENEKKAEWGKHFKPLTEPVGWEPAGGKLPIKEVVDHLEKNRREMMELLTTDKSTQALVATKEFKTIVTLIIPYISVASFARSRAEEGYKWKKREDDRLGQLRPILAEKEKFTVKDGNKREYKETVQKRIEWLGQFKDRQADAFTKEMQEIDKQIGKLNSDKSDAETDFTSKQQKTILDIKKMKEQIESIMLNIETRQFAVTSYVALISNPDLINNVAFINIGSKKRVKQGMKFFIAKFGDAGKFDLKAEIEIQKEYDDSSKAKITKIYDKEKPPVTGDYVVNPFFHPFRPLKVAFVGRKDPRMKINLDEAKKRIIQLGNIVQDKITSDLDFIIVTEPDEDTKIEQNEMFRKAVEFGIPIAYASEILDYLIFK